MAIVIGAIGTGRLVVEGSLSLVARTAARVVVSRPRSRPTDCVTVTAANATDTDMGRVAPVVSVGPSQPAPMAP